MFTRNILLGLATACAFAFNVQAAAIVGEAAPDFTAADIKGVSHTLSAHKGKIVVLEWNNPECPFVKKFYDAGAMQKFQKDAAAKGVVWLSINSSAAGKQGNLTNETAASLLAESKAEPAAYILDADGAIGKLYGAKTTPHMFVIDKEGKLAYAGAIDDKASTDSADIEGARNYVNLAIEALVNGSGKLDVPQTTAYGCGVKYE